MNNEFILDFSDALPEDAAEDQVINNYSLCLTCKPLPNHHHNPIFDWTRSMKVYLTLRSKKITQLTNLSLQSMLFLRKMERYGALWSIYHLSLRIREVLNINLNHPPHAVFGISLWFYGLVLLQLWYLQQEGDDANSLVIEKDNITGEIVSQVWCLSFFNE